MQMTVRKVGWVGWVTARSNLAYLGEVVVRTLFLAIILFIFLQLWRVTFSEMGATRLGGLTLAQMLWYLAMTEAITIANPRVAREVDLDVRTGAIAVRLLRPIPYPLYRWARFMGEFLVRFLMNLTVGLLLVFFFVGPIPFRPAGLGMVLLVLPLAVTLDFLGQMLIGLGAFWLEDTSGLYLIYSRLTMILGGMLIPLELFPELMQRVVGWLPFASIIYAPARLFVDPGLPLFTGVLLRLGFFLTLFTGLVALVYRVAVARINANGG